MTLSCGQNEVFKYLVLQSLLLTVYFRKSNRQKFFFSLSFQHLTFTVWLLCKLLACSLWRRQKYHHKSALRFMSFFVHLNSAWKRNQYILTWGIIIYILIAKQNNIIINLPALWILQWQRLTVQEKRNVLWSHWFWILITNLPFILIN